MAGRAYQTNRAQVNQFAIPAGWQELFHVPDPGIPAFPGASGFEAVYFRKVSGANTEIVISFAGTDGFFTRDQFANVELATGWGSPQLVDAVDYYLAVKAANPNADITFTGHSLGGGLAALMGVFFGRPAVTFDQAPFAKTAELSLLHPDVAASLRQHLSNLTLVDPDQLAARDAMVSALNGFMTQRQALPYGSIPNADLVSTIRVEGEFTSSIRGFNAIGAPPILFQHGPTDISAFTELHAQSLLAAFLQSDQSAVSSGNSQQTLSKVTFKLTNLLGMIFDPELFAHTTGRNNTADENFLERLIRHEEGVYDPATGTASLPADAMVTRFTQDLWKIAQDGGLTLNYKNLADALTAFAMEKYYVEINTSTGYKNTLFSNIAGGSGGIHFDMQDVASTVTSAKGYAYFDQFLRQYYADLGQEYNAEPIRSALPSLRDWYIQAGTDALNATDTGNNNAFMFGSTGSDTLTGGTGNDVLVGNGSIDTLTGGAGNDLLIGGIGNDILIGGDGEDTYVINTGDGNDQIDDSDHSIVKRDGKMFNGGFSQIANTNTYELITDDQVKISINSPATLDFGNGDTITFQDLTTVDLVNQDLAGIRLFKAAEAPTTTLTITGDITPTDIDPNTPGIQAQGDAQSNPIGTSQPYGDILGGSDGNDHILAGELNDDVGGGAGDDWIEGGNGNDYIGGRTGNDLIEGGAGKDLLFGESGDDQLYANTQIDIATAIANGESDTGSGQKGDWLSGNAGDDTLIAGADNDVLTGGGGADLLVAGAGDDYILGDADYYAQYLPEDTPRYSISGTDWYHSSAETFDWTVTIDQDGTAHFYPVVGETNPADSGADVIYAGAGADRVWAGAGDDVLYGDDGDDTLDGQAGNDILIGGADNDVLFGGEDNDYLDGSDGVDTLWGGNGDDDLFGGAGDDKLYGETGANYLDGEDGNDILNSGGPGSNLFGGAGDDDLSAADGGNYLDGEDGTDTLTADGGDNTLFGGAGNDDLSASGGNNYLDGEEGTNTLYADGGGNTLFAGAGDDNLSAGGGNNYLDGGDGTNTIIADGGGNTLYGGAGDDTLSSAGGNSYLEGGDGTNTILADGGGNTVYSGTGDDTLSSTGGNSTLDGGDGNDLLIADLGGNTLDGGAGDDTLSSAGGGSYLDGGDGNDILIADGGNNILVGGAGDDRLSASGGGNTLDGGAGSDTYAFDAGFGEDHIADSDFLIGITGYRVDNPASNIALFNFAFAGSGIAVGLGSLKLSFANGDVLHIDGYDPNDPLNTCAIDTFEFADQTLSAIGVRDEIFFQRQAHAVTQPN